MDEKDVFERLAEMEIEQIALRQELKTLQSGLGEAPPADLSDHLERAILRVWSRPEPPAPNGSGPSVEQRALMDWFGEMRERMGHSEPGFYLSVAVGEDGFLVQGPGLAFADAGRVGDEEIEMRVDAETKWFLSFQDLAGWHIRLPADIVFFRGGRTVARGVLPDV